MNSKQAERIFFYCATNADKVLTLPAYITFSYGAGLPDLARASIPAGGWSGFAYLPSDAEVALGVPYQVFINPEWNACEVEIIATAFHELAHILDWEHSGKVRHKGRVFKVMRKACNKCLKKRGYSSVSKADFSNI